MATDLIASRIIPALATQVWSFGTTLEREFNLFLIGSGAALLTRTEQDGVKVVAPTLVWLPFPARGALSVAPGTSGYVAAVNEKLLQRVASNPLVAAYRQPFIARPLVAGPEVLGGKLAAAAASMQALVDETRGVGAGASTAVGLHLGLVLLQVWRCSGLDTVHRRLGDTVADRFILLVEAHYREGLRVSDYADRLGVGQAQLHASCHRRFGRSPLRLVHERILEEAKAILRLNELSVEQVGFSLGFRDAGYFNRFFKRETGKTPGSYQRQTAMQMVGPSRSFAAWP